MRKALTLASAFFRCRRRLLSDHSSGSSQQSLPMTSIILEKYLNFSHGVHTHSDAPLQQRESTEVVGDRSCESGVCKTEEPSGVKIDAPTPVLGGNVPNEVSANVMSNLKVSERHDLAMIFTCKVCDKRSMKTCSRESYEKGVVVVRCGGCNNLHLIADRLGWFGEPGSIEDLLAAHGDVVKKGSVDSLNLTLEDLAGKKI